MSSAAILARSLLARAAAFCFALALILTQYGLRTVPSLRSPGFDWRAAAIFAAVGCVFPAVAAILSVRANERLGPAIVGAVGNVTRSSPPSRSASPSGTSRWPPLHGYSLSTVVIASLVGRRALAVGPADRTGVLWFLGVGMANGTATFVLYAALGLGSIALAAAGCALPADGGGAELPLARHRHERGRSRQADGRKLTDRFFAILPYRRNRR